jgi:hypothetical protein
MRIFSEIGTRFDEPADKARMFHLASCYRHKTGCNRRTNFASQQAFEIGWNPVKFPLPNSGFSRENYCGEEKNTATRGSNCRVVYRRSFSDQFLKYVY